MKKIITHVLTAIAFCAFSQMAIAQVFPYTMMDGDRYENLTGPSDGVIQLIDSVYYFGSFDEINWTLTGKDDDIVYENNRLISQTSYKRSNDSWLPDLLLSVKRNLAGDPDSTLVKKMTGGSWMNENLTVEEYNELHLPTFSSYSIWKGFWKEYHRFTTEYDSYGNILSRIVMSYDSELDSTVKEYKDDYTYNSENKAETAITSVWLNEAWKQFMRVTFYYNAQNRYDSAVVDFPEGDGWRNGVRFVRTYNADSGLVTTLWQEFINGQWSNYDISKSYFDENGRFTHSLYQKWIDGEWLNYTRDKWEYDQYGNINLEIYEEWKSRSWMPTMIYRYTYDQDRLLLNSSHAFYDGDIFLGKDSIIYYFQKVLGFEELAEENAIIYPNPSNDYFAIQSDTPATRVEVYDNNGRPVKFINTPGDKVDVKDLASGVYHVRVSSGGEIKMVKMVKIE